MEKEPTILDYWRVIWRYRLFIGGLFFASVILTMILSLMMPKSYKATATALPPEVKGTTFLNVPGIASKILPSLKGGPTSTDIVIAMLKSRRMKEDIVRKFDLEEFYETEFFVDAIKKLESSTEINLSKENVISVTVISTKPRLAAEIANFYVEHLNRINEELKLTTEKPIVKVLDIARIPEKKYKPRIKLNMAISGVIALFLGIFISFFYNSIKAEISLKK